MIPAAVIAASNGLFARSRRAKADAAMTNANAAIVMGWPMWLPIFKTRT
jgi:hypothetical protein